MYLRLFSIKIQALELVNRNLQHLWLASACIDAVHESTNYNQLPRDHSALNDTVACNWFKLFKDCPCTVIQ